MGRAGCRDSGPGIPERHLPHIFERFYRADPSRSKRLGGTGLGLSIVKHIVERAGGTVEANSREGFGTTVVVRLPAVAPARPAADRRGSPGRVTHIHALDWPAVAPHGQVPDPLAVARPLLPAAKEFA